MNDSDAKSLCLKLIKSENENEVISVLQFYNLWQDDNNWLYYGNNENNFSTIGNQQSTAEAALVEKLINSVDAVLMKECLKSEILPESKEAPQTIEEAVHRFFGVFKGKLANVDPRIRSELAKNILLVATGDKNNPSYSIIDTGEGQSPNKIPNTFLSLSKSNKLRIPFVQGKFNMGATGSLQFCGHRNIQLIVSKRSIELKNMDNDDSVDCWGFTVVRREDPSMGMRSSAFKYLAPEGKIIRFKSEFLPIIPVDKAGPYVEKMISGSYVKLYDYRLKSGLKTNIKFDLYYKISQLLPNVALPITLFETRDYKQESGRSILSGLGVRLDEDKRDNLEPNFPSSSEVIVQGEKMKVSVFAFKKDQAKRYSLGDGIIFTINGQTHGTLPKAFFERKNVGMSYLSDSILVLADCSAFSGRIREDLFMTSRDRMRDGDIKSEITALIEEIIRNHEGLKALREKRRREELEGMLQNSKPLVDVLNKIIKRSPTLTKLFALGQTIQNPFNLAGNDTQAIFNGKRYPTYFRPSKTYSEDKPKSCNVNRKFRIQYETDASNDYFNRDNDPGSFGLSWEGMDIDSFSLNLWSGLATLNVTLPECASVGDLLLFKSTASDYTQTEGYTADFYVKVIEPAESGKGDDGERKEPPSDKPGDERASSSALNLPNMHECRRSDGENYKFLGNEGGGFDC
ncbi:hypothetical protein A2572_04775 [Candidatus Collierbacteria bacterium RIFOXYD1_FULL_40_9]|uniref:Uncharacterized protein n=1 Tax=Candidatus Collierbacteria bacterium RIFOXYD1_FULL_40_9 TaxID=1817731 RepID=A0A1F5FVK8_9BACT|nr:MAG: hypothetical protein A2572_04775 [Candidatus Collierbacteria bacterium RIFOXYD1_FULL_40_9]